MSKSLAQQMQEADERGSYFNHDKAWRALRSSKAPPKTIQVELTEPVRADLAYCLDVWKRRGVGLSRSDLYRMAIAALASALRRQEHTSEGLFSPQSQRPKDTK
jgi:hypothetical protein